MSGVSGPTAGVSGQGVTVLLELRQQRVPDLITSIDESPAQHNKQSGIPVGQHKS